MGKGNNHGSRGGGVTARPPQSQPKRPQQQQQQQAQRRKQRPASAASDKTHSRQSSVTPPTAAVNNKKRPQRPSQPETQPSVVHAVHEAAAVAATKKQKTAPVTADSSAASSSLFPTKRVHNTYVPLTSYPEPSDDADSRETAAAVLQWLIAPLSIDTFYSHYFERRPFAVMRHSRQPNIKPQLITTVNTLPALLKAQLSAQDPPDSIEQLEEEADVQPWSGASDKGLHYCSGWMGKADVWSLLANKQHDIRYTRDVDVTAYRNHQRTTLNPPNQPRVALADIQKHFKAGCSVRFLSPHTHLPRLHKLLHQLDQALGMQCGANSYLTPAGTQGFSPHYDDVDVFIVQTEGAKRWRLYAPTSASDLLPLESSRNFTQDELGCCVLDVWLKAGDFLYAPRGTVHQCVASEAEDSLHVTVSTSLQSTWGGYVRQFLLKAIDQAMQSDVAMRQVLPRQWHSYMGEQHAATADEDEDEEVEEKRQAFMDHTLQLVERLLTRDDEAGEGRAEELPYDSAADEVALDYMHGRIKPLYSAQQQHRMRSILATVLLPTTLVRLSEADVLRLTASPEDGCVRVHHIADNAVKYKSAPLAHIDVDARLAPAVDALRRAYPYWVRIAQLPFEEGEDSDEGKEKEEEKDGEGDGGVEQLLHLCGVLFDSGLVEATNDQSRATASTEQHQSAEEATVDDESVPIGDEKQ